MAIHRLLNTEEIYNYHKSGMTYKQIAKMFDPEVSEGTISYHIAKHREKLEKEGGQE